MAKHSFFFCQNCHHMFLTAEIVTEDRLNAGKKKARHCCPGCNCSLDYTTPEYYDLDPFSPKDWPFVDGVWVDEYHYQYSGKELFASKNAKNISSFLSLIWCGFVLVFLLALCYLLCLVLYAELF